MSKRKDKSNGKHVSHTLVERGHRPYQGTLRIRKAVEFEYGLGLIQKLLSPLSLVAYGDESTSIDLVAYGFFMVHQMDLDSLEKDLKALLDTRSKVTDARFHSKIVFHGDARKKSEWQNLSEQEVNDLCIEIADLASKYKTSASIGLVHKNTFPAAFPDGKKIQNEDHYFMAYASAAAGLQCKDNFPQLVNTTCLIDPIENCKVQVWGYGNKKLQPMITRIKSFLEPIPVTSPKPILIDMADLLAYSAVKAFSKEKYRNSEICKKITSKFSPLVTDFWWIPSGDTSLLEATLGDDYERWQSGTVRLWHNPELIDCSGLVDILNSVNKSIR